MSGYPAHCAVSVVYGVLWRMSEMDAPRALVFRPLVKVNEALGTRLAVLKKSVFSSYNFLTSALWHRLSMMSSYSHIILLKLRLTMVKNYFLHTVKLIYALCSSGTNDIVIRNYFVLVIL